MLNPDYSIFGAIYGFATRVPYLEWVYVFLAGYLPYILAAVFLYELLRVKDIKRRTYIFLLTIISVVLSWGVAANIIHFFYDRARPFVALGVTPLTNAVATPSFPSGHLAFLAPIAIAGFLINKRVGIWLSIIAILVGFGRIAVGVHYPSDILGGMAAGALGFVIAYKIIPKPET